jgi:hypothetical protein
MPICGWPDMTQFWVVLQETGERHTPQCNAVGRHSGWQRALRDEQNVARERTFSYVLFFGRVMV